MNGGKEGKTDTPGCFSDVGCGDTLQDFDDDTDSRLWGQKDFLGIWDLSEVSEWRKSRPIGKIDKDRNTYEASMSSVGRVAVIVPPKRFLMADME